MEKNDSSSTCKLSPCSPCSHISHQATLAPAKKRKAGRTKFKETRHPIYRGVRRRNGNKWVCEVREPNLKSRIWLGTYPTPEMAARAHDVAALAFRGEFASLNYLDSAWILPRPKSSSHEDIKRAALEAAEAFKPSSTDLSSTSPPSSSSCSSASSKPSHEDDLRFSLMDTQDENEKKVLNNGNSSSMNIEPCPNVSIEIRNECSVTSFLDDEALFNMPVLLDSMAEGLILTPPSIRRGFNWDDMAFAVDLTLWRD
ncbi:dehydration-responsive element-binding protein 1B-like [Ricinus communis]|uniref:CBF-like transcription factor, putative n=1 Tax=Ricinus communis TaxID=3988 RepID=B9T1R8_RICCO|nr:dehydration-responsive element-binding protein 1B [Ricinus communis]XP_048234193.1 dehydration-responsive element-binding protein 1B-like [Ricinus communis]XP_048234197.1 dehydration-responsive element-binding protein 1B-like [Ricinus communis]EEF30190.1 CBF-like transcription factor, putative [Ricinus communis]|eukprot:XP_002532187.1 dehydration-responsive element-binding protein 1B [Ricinus communis]